MENAILKTEIKELKLVGRGKVRDIYEIDDNLLIVTTDRISAFDVILPNGIPNKGRVLNQLSLFWFSCMEDIIKNHVVESDVNRFPSILNKYRNVLKDRSVIVKKAKPYPFECVVRGYLSGSGWKDYRSTGSVCGIELPPRLVESEKLNEPIFTPATKAQQGHDINVNINYMVESIGNVAYALRARSIEIYKKASEFVKNKGIIIADTKMEFGLCNNDVIIIDELLTPDSSRFWLASKYEKGASQESFDKQIVRDYLLTLDWDKRYPGPKLPNEIVQKTSERYEEIFKMIVS